MINRSRLARLLLTLGRHASMRVGCGTLLSAYAAGVDCREIRDKNLAHEISRIRPHYLRQMRKQMRLPAFVCLSVC